MQLWQMPLIACSVVSKTEVCLDELVRKDKIELHFCREGMVIGKHSSASDHMRLKYKLKTSRCLAQKAMSCSFRKMYAAVSTIKSRKAKKIKNWYGPAPLGYLNQRDERGNSIIIVDPVRGPLVQRFFMQYATGAHTLGEMQIKCREWGLRSKRGLEVSKSSLYRMVNNPFYFGEMLIKEEIIEHCHKPLITRNIWETCQDVLNGWDKKPFQYGEKDFLSFCTPIYTPRFIRCQ